MVDPSDAFSTLDDFLLSLADGITHAQDELSRQSGGDVRREYAYHMPRVDFEIKMNLRVVDDPALTERYRRFRPIAPNSRHLLFRPLAAEEVSSVMEVAAVVRGAFVAVPANHGLPRATLIASVTKTDATSATVRIVARRETGEPVVGVDIEVNVDREESVDVSAASGVTMTVDADTHFERGVVTTDATGAAAALLQIAPTQQPGLLVLVLDALGQTETVVYEVGS